MKGRFGILGRGFSAMMMGSRSSLCVITCLMMGVLVSMGVSGCGFGVLLRD